MLEKIGNKYSDLTVCSCDSSSLLRLWCGLYFVRTVIDNETAGKM